MCIGTPVLTSTGSCFTETGGDAALYANPLKPDEIGKQIKRILTDNNLRTAMIKKGYNQANKFTDEQVVNNLINMYI